MFRSSVSYAVIGVVAKQRNLSIQSLYKLLTEKGVSISLPNFYKIIAHMIDDQILIKPNGRVQLHALFMRYIFSLTEDSQKSYLADDSNSIQKLQVGQQETREEANLYDLNVIRMDLLGQLMKTHPDERSHHYTSHPYYLLSETEKETSNLEDVAIGDKKSYFLIGNTTFLDRYATALLSKEYFLAKCKNDTPFPEQGYCVDVIGDYIVECTLPASLSEHYELFFNSILNLEGYKKHMFAHLLKMKAPCSLKLIYSPEHAAKIRTKIVKHCK